MVAASAGSQEVIGELYVVSPATLAQLDDYEGYDPITGQGEFVRRLVRLKKPLMNSWTYFYTGSTTGKPLVLGGDWTHYVQHLYTRQIQSF